jgi:lipopolysaccharide/colanic/teichoic acid biosynthesis glycosyltransferase
VTRLGRLLRKSSLDELPQLVNILFGDMTLAGPRPEALGLAARYPTELAYVFRYRPGLTGPVQLRMRDADPVGRTTEEIEQDYLRRLVPQRVALDATYLDDPSLSKTIGLLGETARHVLSRTGRRIPTEMRRGLAEQRPS